MHRRYHWWNHRKPVIEKSYDLPLLLPSGISEIRLRNKKGEFHFSPNEVLKSLAFIESLNLRILFQNFWKGEDDMQFWPIFILIDAILARLNKTLLYKHLLYKKQKHLLYKHYYEGSKDHWTGLSWFFNLPKDEFQSWLVKLCMYKFLIRTVPTSKTTYIQEIMDFEEPVPSWDHGW